MFPDRLAEIIETRVRQPGLVAEAAAARRRAPSVVGPEGRLVIVAADHPARGSLGAGRERLAMADRADLLERLCVALDRPGVDGVLGTADVLEDLLLLGALDGKIVIGSMNRGGLAGTVFEIDDRFTGYDAPAIARMGFDGGKMLLRIDPDDLATSATLQACAHAVSDLAARRLVAMIEPFISHRVDGRIRNDLSPEAMMRAVAVASGLGTTSAYSWLKVPVVPDMERVMAASTLPALLLGGEVPDDPESAYAGWRKALRLPNVKGLVAGRSLLYPADDDVAAAVDTAVSLLLPAGRRLEWLFERLAGDGGRFAPGQQPAHDGRDQRHADQDPQQAGHGDAGQLRELVQLVGAEEADRREITAGRSDDRPGQRERGRGHRGERAPGRAAGPGGSQRAQVTGGLAADQADAHREDAEREHQREDRGRVGDLRERRDAVDGLDAQPGRGRGLPGVRDLGGGQPARRLDQPAGRGRGELELPHGVLGDHRVRRRGARRERADLLDRRVGQAAARQAGTALGTLGREPQLHVLRRRQAGSHGEEVGIGTHLCRRDPERVQQLRGR